MSLYLKRLNCVHLWHIMFIHLKWCLKHSHDAKYFLYSGVHISIIIHWFKNYINNYHPFTFDLLHNFFSVFLHFNFLLLFNYSCVSFLPIPPPQPSWTPLPHPPPPPWFCPCVLYISSCNPLFPLSPTHYPLANVRLFLTSMSLVIFCLLFSSIYHVPVKGEIIWYLSLTVWLFHLT